MNNSQQIQTPSDFPRVYFNRYKRKGKGGCDVIEHACYSYDSHTNEQGKSVKTNTVRIGVVRSEDGLGVIEFNDLFLRKHPHYEQIEARRVQAGKKGRNDVLFFKKSKAAEALSGALTEQEKKSALGNVRTVKFGLTYFLKQLLCKSHTGRALRMTCGKDAELYNRIISLMMFTAVNGADRLYDMQLWARDHLMPSSASFDKDCISRVFAKMDSKFILKFYQNKHAVITNDLRKKKIAPASRRTLALDGTNFDSWSHNLMAAPGKSKSGSDAEIMSLMVLMDQKSGDVFFHQSLAGNITDISTLESAIKHCKYYNSGPVTIVADRGYWSVYNVSICYAHDTSFLLHVKLQSSLLKKMISEHVDEMFCGRHSVLIERKAENCYGGRVEKLWSWFCPRDGKTKRSPIYFYIYFNHENFMAVNRKLFKKNEEINELFDNYKEELARAVASHKKKPAMPELTAEHNRLINEGLIEMDPADGRYVMNKEKLFRRMVTECCWVLASDQKMPVEEAYWTYRERNAIESLNRVLKNQVELNTNGSHNRDSYEAKQFLGICAAELHMQIRNSVNDYNQEQPKADKAELKYNSIHCTLTDLDNIEATYDGAAIIPTSNLSNRHERLCNACGVKTPILKDKRFDRAGLELGIVD